MNKKPLINFIVAVFSQVVIFVLGIIVPKIIISNYGSDTHGTINTISQIFAYLALVEAGISQASKNALFKHFKSGNKNEISHYASITKNYYKRMTVIYLCALLLVSVLFPFILKTNLDYWTIFFYTLIEGVASVFIFYFTGTWSCLLSSDGKTYIVNLINVISKILLNIIKIILVLNNYGIVFIQVGFLITTIIQFLIMNWYMKRKYGWVNYSASLPGEKLPDRNAFVITEVAWTIFSSTDLIVLSVFVSTSLSSVYSTYNMVFLAITGLMNSIFHSLTYYLGQSYSDNIEKYKDVHDVFNSFFLATITVLMCVCYLLINPFINLYIGNSSDVNYVYHELPLLFCLIQIISWSRYVSGFLTGLAGYAKKVSFVSLIEALINICLSIILVQYLGIVGVLMATVIALPIKVVYCFYICEFKVLNRPLSKQLLIYLINYLCFFSTILLGIYWKPAVLDYFDFVLWGIILTFICFIVVFGFNLLINKKMFYIFKILRYSKKI